MISENCKSDPSPPCVHPLNIFLSFWIKDSFLTSLTSPRAVSACPASPASSHFLSSSCTGLFFFNFLFLKTFYFFFFKFQTSKIEQRFPIYFHPASFNVTILRNQNNYQKKEIRINTIPLTNLKILLEFQLLIAFGSSDSLVANLEQFLIPPCLFMTLTTLKNTGWLSSSMSLRVYLMFSHV